MAITESVGPQAPPPAPQGTPPQNGALGIIGLVLAIVAAVTAFIPVLGFITWLIALPALIIGIVALKTKKTSKKMAIATICTAGGAWVLALLVSLILIIGLVATSDSSTSAARPRPVAEQPSATLEPKPTEDPEPTPTPTPTPTAAAPAAPEPSSAYGAPYPAAQAEFIKAIDDGVAAYRAAQTELQRSQAIKNRDAALCSITAGGAIDGWVGKILEIGANGDGYAHVRIEISDNVVVQTWNNAFSDMRDDTLIKPGPVFDNLVSMNEGTLVRFSGVSIGEDGSCVRRANLTETFYALDPNFIVRFSAISAQ